MKRSQMIPLLFGGGLAAPTGAAISGSAVIGQTLTASATGTVTSWQWKRGGSDIGGATNSTYVLVDADFGYAITVVATNASGSDTSAATGLVAELPAESLGAELLTNGSMETGSPPTSWNAISGATLSAEAEERTGGAGTKSLRVAQGTANQYPAATQTAALSSGDFAELFFAMRNIDATGGVAVAIPNLATFTAYTGTSWRNTRHIARASGNNPLVNVYLENGGAIGRAGLFDDVSVRTLTPNGQLTAPSANMRLTQLYTLPASPVMGDQLWIPLRISDWGAGNYWLALLEYTGSQWNITLYSVATHTRTSRIAATNIGASNGIRINANGDNWTLETTADGGSNWTSRGTVTNATYNTATGVNALWTSGFTAGNLAYEAAV